MPTHYTFNILTDDATLARRLAEALGRSRPTDNGVDAEDTLLAGAQQALAHAKGEDESLKTTTVALPLKGKRGAQQRARNAAQAGVVPELAKPEAEIVAAVVDLLDTAPAKEYTSKEIQEAATRAGKKNLPATIAAVKALGHQRVPEITPEQYAEAMQRFEEIAK